MSSPAAPGLFQAIRAATAPGAGFLFSTAAGVLFFPGASVLFSPHDGVLFSPVPARQP
jgi:hypothetical protein